MSDAAQLVTSAHIGLWVERRDRGSAAALTVVAAIGLLAAVGLAKFGMPPVDLHGPLHRRGIMDPLCGMTRGVAATMGADLARAWWYNPASPLVVAGGLVVVMRWVVGRATGLWLRARVRHPRLTVLVIGALIVVLEVNQQLHVSRLR